MVGVLVLFTKIKKAAAKGQQSNKHQFVFTLSFICVTIIKKLKGCDTLELTPRLKKIADLIPRGSVVADIGTDHAYLPAYCILNGISTSAFAMDVNVGPLKSAENTINQYGISQNVELRLSDGIEKLSPGEADVIVIAGMGGLLIESILKAHPEVLKDGTILILQPMLAQKELREYLYSSKNAVTDEYLAVEGEKVYNIIVARAGCEIEPNETDLVLGKNVSSNSPECFLNYTDKLMRVLNKIIDGNEKSSNPDREVIAKAKKELELIQSEVKSHENK